MSSQISEIPVKQPYISERILQKLKFIDNALENGWSVKKRDGSYVFSKKHEGKKEVFMDNYLDDFIFKNMS